MDLNRAKERERLQRLSEPIRTPVEAPPTNPKAKKRKRPRNKKRLPAPSDGRELIYYSSSDDEHHHAGRAAAFSGDDDKEAAAGGFDAGLASYKKLLSALEAGGSKASAAESEDTDLAAAMMARRMQREGRDGNGSESNDSSSGGSDAEEDYGDSEEGGEDEEDEEESDGEQEGKKEDLNGPHGTPSGMYDIDEEGDASTGFEAVAAEGDISADEDGHLETRAGKTADGRSKDEFCRHFVSTPVFPTNKAAEMLSTSGRPSFKPLSGAMRSKWGSVGLSASASRGAKVPQALPPGASLSQDLGLLPSLAERWNESNGGAASKLQSLLLPALTGYRDMLYCGWRDEDAGEIRRSYALHALNHALTSQRRIVRHTIRLRKAAQETKLSEALARGKSGIDALGDKDAGNGQVESQQQRGAKTVDTPPNVAQTNKQDLGSIYNKNPLTGKTIDVESDDWQRDQGFTRPKVLILLPFRGLAHELVEIMIGLLGPKTIATNKDRFDEEFGPDKEEDIDGLEEDEIAGGSARAERAKAVLERKPADWKAILGEGRNVDDMFTLGISLSPGGGKGKPGEGKGVGVRLYCDFYNSDIIIASPVAIHRASVPEGEGGSVGESVDSDFLSSVEVCIMDKADVFLMQNWAYVPDIAEVLNSRPTGDRAAKADFSRVRPLFLHEQGRLFRQTLVFSSFQVCLPFLICPFDNRFLYFLLCVQDVRILSLLSVWLCFHCILV